MSNKETRNTILYIIGTLFVLGLIFFGLTQFAANGVGIFQDNDPEKIYSEAPKKTIDTNKSYTATFKTSLGEFSVELYPKNAPTTVNNFVFLAKDGYYNGVKFHRVVRDFIAQSGSRLSLDKDPKNDGLGGPGYRFADEVNWDSLKLTKEQKDSLTAAGFKTNTSVKSKLLDKYYLAMANAGPDTNGSQFFFVLAGKDDENIKALQGRHTVFGLVKSGKEVIDAINKVELLDEQTSSPRPATDIVIESITISES
jgi:peptidyl-prolyl cis-trans isomerase B (cyclophilin B)